ncbi:MAG: AMP-binding protein, partial [Alphaproteobacteria bacterium]|nr:AMP-binding protein [Alphaproteobacteria bacterium]
MTDQNQQGPGPAEVAGWASECNMRAVEAKPLPANIGALLGQAAAETPDRPVLVFFDDDDTLTYRELERRVARTANAFTRLGVKHGTHV